MLPIEPVEDPELAEFAETPGESQAEPAFREGLRERLWKWLRRSPARDEDEPTSLG